MSETYDNLMKETYTRRAATYDASSGGYHVDLARDFVDLVNPQPGERVLDLACGTGLVAIDVAGRVGVTGKVVAVDWSPEMQGLARAKVASGRGDGGKGLDGADADADADAGAGAEIDWVLADITSEELLEQEAVRRVVVEEGGFDAITMCQGYMYLLDMPGAIRFWTEKLLRKGGRIVSDMTTEDPSLQYLMTYHLPLALNPSVPLSSGRVHITSRESFEDMFTAAGLEVVKTVRTKLYGPEYWFATDEETSLEVLAGEIERNLPWTPEHEKLREAKEVWPRIWKNAATTRSDGSRGVEGRHPFYICIGRKRR